MKYLPLVVVSLFPLTAHAGDATHAACIGFAALDEGGTKHIRKLALEYDEQRAGADQRKTTLRGSFNGRTFTGSATSKAAPSVTLKLANGTEVVFDGTVEALVGSGLQLTGTFTLDKHASKLSAVLECTDV